MTATFTTPAMSCGGCANNIRRVLSREPGVRAVDVTLAAKRVEITYDPETTSPERLTGALTTAGYPPAETSAAADTALSGR